MAKKKISRRFGRFSRFYLRKTKKKPASIRLIRKTRGQKNFTPWRLSGKK